MYTLYNKGDHSIFDKHRFKFRISNWRGNKRQKEILVKNFIHFHIFQQKKRRRKNASLITFYSSKKKKKMPPSLINFDKKGPENQVINFAWPNPYMFTLW
jgi:hypothetical protein